MDTVSKSERSSIMAQVKATKNRSTELAFVKILQERSIHGWRRNYPLKGHPDFVFQQCRVAVFIDGCFWHKCPFHCRIPSSNCEYWERKIVTNAKRDRRINQALRKAGWTIIRFWEHEMKGGRTFTFKINRLRMYLNGK